MSTTTFYLKNKGNQMPRWNTQLIKDELEVIIPITSIEVEEGEDYTTDRLTLKMGGVEDTLFVRGFSITGERTENTYDVDIENIELTDDLSSDGGLQSRDYRLARTYIDVRQYFINRGFNVVPSLDPYF
jgi:hypothetical protein